MPPRSPSRASGNGFTGKPAVADALQQRRAVRARLRVVGEQSHVARYGAADRRDAVQRVAALEDHEGARGYRARSDRRAAVPAQYPAHSDIVLIRGDAGPGAGTENARPTGSPDSLP